MNTSIELTSRSNNEKRFNLRILTEARENFEDSKEALSEFKLGNFKTTRLRKELSNANVSKKTLTSFKTITRKNGGWIVGSSIKNQASMIETVKQEIEANVRKGNLQSKQSLYKILEQAFQTSEIINQSFYNYRCVESSLKLLNQRIKELKSATCEFYCLAMSGFILFEYCSLSLTIFYFDKALKALSAKSFYEFDWKLEMMIYKYTAKVFVQAKKIKEAKDMAYMYLRKAWKYGNVDEQMSAYDLLGQIQSEDGNIELSRYFHWRMCQAVREEKQILQMSNQELDKSSGYQIEFSVYENIMQFVKNQQQIVSILSNHFRSEAEEEAKGFLNRRKNKQVFLYTHRSSNRVLKNHRNLERKLIDEKQSKQLHFIRSKDLKKLHKIITQFNSFIFELRKHMEYDLFKDSVSTNQKSNYQTY